MTRHWWKLVLLALWIAAPAWAQTTGQLRVSVVDDEMALPIPRVALRLSQQAVVAEASTDANGEHLFTELAPGAYVLEVSKAGFGAVSVEGITVDVGRTRVQTVSLSATSVEEVVVVETKRSPVKSLTKKLLDKIPAGRSYQTAVTFAPGVQEGTGGNPNMAGGAYNQNTEQYTDHGVNPVEIAERDNLSTFAVDVDTGSYTIARRKLFEGQLPPEASVRVEEMVNALRYDYPPAPEGLMPFAVHMEALPHPLAPGRKVLLRVALQGREVPAEKRGPVHLTFLVDVSGSMQSADKLPLAREALHFLVDELGPEDQVAIVTYAGGVRRVLEPTYTTRKDEIHAAIDTLSSGGGTGMHDGMAEAYRMAEAMFLDGAENRVIVLSDGDANLGPSRHADILKTLEQWAGKGITLSTVGFGMGNYKDTMMEQLADKGDGNYAYVDSAREAQRLFGTDLAGTLVTIARDVKVQVLFPPETVLAYRLVGYENRDVADEDFRDDTVDGGEIGSGHQVTALYELDLQADPGDTLARVQVRAKPPGPEAPSAEHVTAIGTADILKRPERASRATRLAFATATFAEVLRRSPHVAEITWDDVIALVEDAIDPEREAEAELLKMVRQAAKLDGARVSAR